MEAKAAVGEGCEQSGRIVTKENISIKFIFLSQLPIIRCGRSPELRFVQNQDYHGSAAQKVPGKGFTSYLTRARILKRAHNGVLGPQWGVWATLGSLAHNGVLGL